MYTVCIRKMSVCKGVKKNGLRCVRKIDDGDFCWQHEGQTLVEPVKKVYKTPIRVKIDNTKRSISELEHEMEELGRSDMDVCELSEMVGRLSVRKSKLEKYLDECMDKERGMTRMERTLKVPHFEKGGVSVDEIKGCVSETNDKTFRKMMDRELGRFKSQQKTFEYKKWRNKKT